MDLVYDGMYIKIHVICRMLKLVDYNIMTDNDRDTMCDYDGLVCIDSKRLVKPSTALLMPWNDNGCDCLPSCVEHELKVIGARTR